MIGTGDVFRFLYTLFTSRIVDYRFQLLVTIEVIDDVPHVSHREANIRIDPHKVIGMIFMNIQVVIKNNKLLERIS